MYNTECCTVYSVQLYMYMHVNTNQYLQVSAHEEILFQKDCLICRILSMYRVHVLYMYLCVSVFYTAGKKCTAQHIASPLPPALSIRPE
jgi:hypothetical protein